MDANEQLRKRIMHYPDGKLGFVVYCYTYLLEIQGSWALPSDDTAGYSVSKQLTDWLDEQVPQWLAEAGMGSQYLPFFMNDAAGDQDVTGSYKDVAKFRALQKSVDPNGLFSTRAGGFKY
jgi:hypothetical protein